jgi:hypothetical protein
MGGSEVVRAVEGFMGGNGVIVGQLGSECL